MFFFRLRANNGREALRDIVQFVPFRDFRQVFNNNAFPSLFLKSVTLIHLVIQSNEPFFDIIATKCTIFTLFVQVILYYYKGFVRSGDFCSYLWLKKTLQHTLSEKIWSGFSTMYYYYNAIALWGKNQILNLNILKFVDFS